MTIAVPRIRKAFDRRIGGNGHRARIAFVAICGEINIDLGLLRSYDNVRDSNALTGELACSKIRVNSDVRADEIDNGGRVRIGCGSGNILVPSIIRGKRKKSIQTCTLTQADCATCHRRRWWIAARRAYGHVESAGSAGTWIGIADRYSKGSRRACGSGSRELSGRYKCCIQSRSCKQYFGAVCEFASGNGEIKGSGWKGGGIYGTEHRNGIQQSDCAGTGGGGYNRAGRGNSDSGRAWKKSRRRVEAGSIDCAKRCAASRDPVHGPVHGLVGIAGYDDGELLRVSGTHICNRWGDGNADASRRRSAVGRSGRGYTAADLEQSANGQDQDVGFSHRRFPRQLPKAGVQE